MRKCCVLLGVLIAFLTLARSQGARQARLATCTQGTDVFLVVDGSASVMANNFQLMKDALIQVIDVLQIDPVSGTVLGVLVYSSFVDQVIPFNPFLNKAQIKASIQNLRYPAGGTFTALALDRMLEVFQNESRPGAQKLAIVFTDGKSSVPGATAMEAKLVKRAGIIVASVGIGPSTDENELLGIASKPELVFRFVNFQILRQQILDLFDSICTNISPCDWCTIINGVGFNLIAGDCTRFVQCVKLGNRIHEYQHQCPSGLFWDQSVLTCNYPNKVSCLSDGCRKAGVNAAPALGNCRMYWTCNAAMRRSDRLDCCPANTGFNPLSQVCDFGSFCPDICPFEKPTTPPIIQCSRKAVSGDASRFRVIYDDGFSVSYSCPPNRLFSQDDCGCTRAVAAPRFSCPKELVLDCSRLLRDSSGNSLPFLNEGVDVVSAPGARNGQACRFHGNSRLLFWRFSNAWFGNNVYIRVRFRPDPNSNPGKPEILVANNDCKQSPSVSVSYDRAGQSATGLVLTGTNPDTVTTPGNANNWLEVTYRYDGSRLTLDTNDGISSFTNSRPVAGMVQTVKCALHIGYTNQPGLSNFHGLIDEVTVSFCQP